MRRRTKAREYALQLLYQLDLTRNDLDESLAAYWQSQEATDSIRAFTEHLVRGTVEHRERIDELIRRYADHWQLERMATVDRNVLRLGVYELLFVEDVPPKVTINEAVELAKRYGDLESSRFVNGVLDQIHKQTDSPKTDSPPASSVSP